MTDDEKRVFKKRNFQIYGFWTISGIILWVMRPEQNETYYDNRTMHPVVDGFSPAILCKEIVSQEPGVDIAFVSDRGIY